MLDLIGSSLIFITSFLFVLSALVFFHELGHYSVGRFFGVAVERFSIGFGKPIFRHKAKSGTEWTISRIPLGGYVKFLGDAGAASNPDTDKLTEIRENLEAKHGEGAADACFHFKPLWQRALIVLAGPVANFVLAVILFAMVALFYGQYEVKSVVLEVHEGSAAEAAGVQVGDRFLMMNGTDVSERVKLVSYISLRSGEPIDTVVDRNGEEVRFILTPDRLERKDAIGGRNKIGTAGVLVGGAGAYEKINYNPISALGYGASQVSQTVSMTGTYIGRIFQGKEDGKAFGGPVRIATMVGKTSVDIVKQETTLSQKLRGLAYSLLTLAALLSIGLGVANLMPIPALDGGHLIYYGYEALAGRPLSEEKQEFGFRIGFAVLITLLVVLTINDASYVRSMG